MQERSWQPWTASTPVTCSIFISYWRTKASTALTSGTRLGPYQIASPIGAGGMGEVYKAKDTRLDRIVAIKVLPTELSHNEELPQRFEREARAVSSLNHPNICTLDDIGREGDVDFMVMEYLEGETRAGPARLGNEDIELEPVFSPDGNALAYQSDETGAYNVYVRPLSSSEVPTRVSPAGGSYPEWRQDDKELFYLRPDGTLMAVALEADSGFGEPTELFQIALRPTENYDLFDVAPNGERFLVLEQIGPQRSLTLIQNWPALLER